MKPAPAYHADAVAIPRRQGHTEPAHLHTAPAPARLLSSSQTKMSFDDVYCVTPRQLRPAQGEQMDELVRILSRELPEGYREYLTTFGWGRMCEWLWVDRPEHVRENLPEEMPFRQKLWVEQWDPTELPWRNPGPLSPTDLAEAVRFGSSQEGDYFVSCPRHGNAIFMIPRHASEI
jgi:hypothetical protein